VCEGAGWKSGGDAPHFKGSPKERLHLADKFEKLVWCGKVAAGFDECEVDGLLVGFFQMD
jgi:hypothetical protein